MAGNRPTETELLERARQGDVQAGAELLNRHRDRLRQMIAIRLDRRVGARVGASDIVQEAINQALARLPQYLAQPRVALYPWLRQIAWDRLLRVHRDHIKTEKRSVLKEHAWKPNLSDESLAELAHCIVTDSVSPSQQAIEAERQARTKAALALLKSLDREILVLRHLEQLSVAEIAAVLDISQTAVTSRHLRAVRRLRRLLGDEPSS